MSNDTNVHVVLFSTPFQSFGNNPTGSKLQVPLYIPSED